MALIDNVDLNEIKTLNNDDEPLHKKYWRIRNETQDKVTRAIKDGGTNGVGFTSDQQTPTDLNILLTELNDIAPVWLTHSLDGETIKHSISSEKLLEVVKAKTPIVFTERYPDGIEYVGTHWREIAKKSHAKELIKNAVVDEFQTVNLYDNITPHKFRQHSLFVELRMSKHQSITFDNSMLVNFQNATVNVLTGEQHPHSKGDYLTELIPVDYEDSAYSGADAGLVYEYAKHLLGDEVQTLVEWFGYMFFNDMTTMNHIIFIQGVGGNGKSTLLRILSYAFGDFASGYSLSALSGKDGGRMLAGLHGKRANIIAESDTYISDKGLTLLKKLTGGDKVTANPKNKPTFTFTNRAKFIVSANFNLPDIENEPEYRRRFALLNAGAPAIETMKDPLGFKEKYSMDNMIKELPKFVGYSIRQARKALDKKELTILPETKARTNQWLENSDPVQRFVDSFMIDTSGTYGATLGYILEHFNNFLKDETGGSMGRPQLKKALERKAIFFEPSPRKGNVEDDELIDDYKSNKRVRARGKGIIK